MNKCSFYNGYAKGERGFRMQKFAIGYLIDAYGANALSGFTFDKWFLMGTKTIAEKENLKSELLVTKNHLNQCPECMKLARREITRVEEQIRKWRQDRYLGLPTI